jgi:glucosylceramidase
MRRTRFAPLLALALVLAPFAARAAHEGHGAQATPAASTERTVDPAVKVYVSSAAGALVEAPAYAASAGRHDFEVLPDKRRQTMAGWGGAFNEKGWEALQALDADARAEVLRRVFAPGEGLSLNLNRIPIGSSDYALSRYSLAEIAGDLKMEKFSIERDRKMLIPYIRAAQALDPKMRFWGSAWSPPPWMKTNGEFNSGKMKDDAETYAAYALYLAKFVEAYRAEKIPVEAVAVQNEPYILTAYPSCRWEPKQYRTFVRDHLGPTLAARKSGATVMLGTFNQPDNEAHAEAVLEDEKARPFVGVLGLQWDGLSIARSARKLVPSLPIWHTETDCGNHHWERGFDPDKPQNDMDYAVTTWRHIRRYLAGGAELYSLWNIVLDETGKSIDADRPWPQNSAIVVDRSAKRVTYTPMFLAFQHWSRFAGAGSTVLEPCGTDNGLAAVRPDGSVAVQLMNPGTSDATMRVQLGKKAWDAILPPRSFATMLIPAQKP